MPEKLTSTTTNLFHQRYFQTVILTMIFAISLHKTFTIRVSGSSSNIDDRRNWDEYLVDGEVMKIVYLTVEQASKNWSMPVQNWNLEPVWQKKIM